MSDYGDDFENYDDENFEVKRDLLIPHFVQAGNRAIMLHGWL